MTVRLNSALIPDLEVLTLERPTAEPGDQQRQPPAVIRLAGAPGPVTDQALLEKLRQIRAANVLLLSADVEPTASSIRQMLKVLESQPDIASVSAMPAWLAGLETTARSIHQADYLQRFEQLLARTSSDDQEQIPAPLPGAILLGQTALAAIRAGTFSSLHHCWQQLSRRGLEHRLCCRAAVEQADEPAARRHAPDQVARKRLIVGMEMIKATPLPLILQVTHAMGGGVERHVGELVETLGARAWSLVLRPGPHGALRLALGGGGEKYADELLFSFPRDAEALRKMLQGLGIGRTHVHHVKGFPTDFWPWLESLGVPLDLTLHDYSIISGSPTLTDCHGQYVEGPGASYELADASLAAVLQDLAARAERCMVPSRDMQRRLGKLLPYIGTQVHAHPDAERTGIYPQPSAPQIDGPLRVLCLGALGREKGVELLRDAATIAKRRGLPLQFVLLGSAHIRLPDSVLQLGPYRDAELPALLNQHQPHLVWFPAQWPETWSYTLSAALELGLPVIASRIGAFIERLEGRPLSWLEDPGSAEQWVGALMRAREQLLAASPNSSWQQNVAQSFYSSNYLVPDTTSVRPCAFPKQEDYLPRHINPSRGSSAQSWRKYLLSLALAVRELPVLGVLIARLPYNVQRRIKRLLSVSPMR